MFLFNFRMSGFTLLEDPVVKFEMCQILMKKENTMIRGLVFKVFPVLGYGKIFFQRQVGYRIGTEDGLRGVQPAARGLPGAQGGCECGPTQNRKFT